MKTKSVVLIVPALLLSSVLFAQKPAGAPAATPAPTMGQTPVPTMGQTPAPTMGKQAQQGPMTGKEVIAALKKKEPTDQLLKELDARGVNFEMDADTEKALRKAKASDEVIKAVTVAGPKEREAAAKSTALASGQTIVPKEESEDFKALENEPDPDKDIALAEAYVKKYPHSEVLSYAYAFEAHAYETKGDVEQLVVYADRSLALKPDNLMSLLMAAYAIPQPQFIKKHEADEEKQLDKAEAYCKETLKDVDALKQLSNEQPAEFAARKAGYNSNIHGDLGMIHLDRAQLGLMSLDTAELVKAVDEYKLATTVTDKPDPSDFYRMGEAYRLQGKVDDAIAAFTKASELGQGVLKQYADQQIAVLKKAKAASAGAPAAAPAKQ